jgi:hypothetical protein
MTPRKAKALIGETVSTVALVPLTEMLIELGISPLPVKGVIEAAERKWRLPFCEVEKELLATVGEIFILPLFTHRDHLDPVVSAADVWIAPECRPPAGLCELGGACGKHYLFDYPQVSDATVVVPASVDLTTLILLFTKIASELTVFSPAPRSVYAPVDRYTGWGQLLHVVERMNRYALRYDEAVGFVEWVRGKGGVEGMARSLLAEMAVAGTPANLFECPLPYKVATADELLRLPPFTIDATCAILIQGNQKDRGGDVSVGSV